MTFVTFTKLKPKPLHLSRVLKCLGGGERLSPQEIGYRTGLTMTAVKCVLAQLEGAKKLEVTTQATSPRTLVSLAGLCENTLEKIAVGKKKE